MICKQNWDNVPLWEVWGRLKSALQTSHKTLIDRLAGSWPKRTTPPVIMVLQ